MSAGLKRVKPFWNRTARQGLSVPSPPLPPPPLILGSEREAGVLGRRQERGEGAHHTISPKLQATCGPFQGETKVTFTERLSCGLPRGLGLPDCESRPCLLLQGL